MPLPSLRRAGPALRLALALCITACAAEPAPEPRLVSEWIELADELAQGRDVRAGAGLRASVALAMYEAYAADERSNLRSLAGQVNGLWSVPRPADQVDAAIVNAEAQRRVLNALLENDAARRMIDSVAAAQLSARAAAGVRAAVRERSLRHAERLAGAVLVRAGQDPQRTWVLRHARECAYQRSEPGETIRLAGDTASTAASPLGPDVEVEAFVLRAVTAADLAASSGGTPDCVRQRVQARLRTR